ncbi:hypothetical protein Tco_1007401, partial [Tanacetum coccineum]
KGDDSIDVFLTARCHFRYPNTINSLRNSQTLGNQATIKDGASRNNSRKQRILTCYNYKGEGHMSKQCTKPRRKRDDLWFKDKESQKVNLQSYLYHKASLSADDLVLHTDSDCDELNTAKVALMANLSHYGSDVIAKNLVHSPECILSSRPAIVEVPKELPKVSMVNTSLKKLKHYLAGFGRVCQRKNPPTAITVACGNNMFLESKTFEVKMNQVLNENERLLEQVLSKDIVNIIVNSSVNIASVNVHECEKCLKLETELLNKKDFIEKEIYDKLFKSFTTLEKHCISLEVDTQHNRTFSRGTFLFNLKVLQVY